MSALRGEIHRAATDEKDLLETSRLMAGGDSRALQPHLRIFEGDQERYPIPALAPILDAMPLAAPSGIHFEALTMISSASGARLGLRVAVTAPGLRGTIMTGPMKAQMS